MLILLPLVLVLDILFGLLLGDGGAGIQLFLHVEVHDGTLACPREAKLFLNPPRAIARASEKWARLKDQHGLRAGYS